MISWQQIKLRLRFTGALRLSQGHIEAVIILMNCQFPWRRKPEYPEETTDLWQVTDTLKLSTEVT